MAALPNTISYKMAIVGDVGTGKTTFLTRGAAQKHSDPNISVDIYPLEFNTNRGKVSFNCWDPIVPNGLQDAAYIHTDCAIIMYDVTSKSSYKSVRLLYKELRQLCGDIPIVLCGNKVDVDKRRGMATLEPGKVESTVWDDMDICMISAHANFNWHVPFLHLARKLAGDPNLRFLELPALVPPEIPGLNFAARVHREIDG